MSVFQDSTYYLLLILRGSHEEAGILMSECELTFLVANLMCFHRIQLQLLWCGCMYSYYFSFVVAESQNVGQGTS